MLHHNIHVDATSHKNLKSLMAHIPGELLDLKLVYGSESEKPTTRLVSAQSLHIGELSISFFVQFILGDPE